jgi:aspartate aminotransferase/aminotransferase
VYSLSKSYAMTGWRVGYTAAPPALADLMGRVQEPLVACVSAFVQKAAEAALTGPQDCVREMRDSYRGRRDMVVDLLREHNLYRYTPRGAFFAMVDVSEAGADARDFALRLVREGHVSTVPGSAFGDAARGQIRISMAAAPDRLREGVRRIARLLRS